MEVEEKFEIPTYMYGPWISLNNYPRLNLSNTFLFLKRIWASTRSLIGAFTCRLNIIWLLSYWLHIIWSVYA